MGKKKLTPFDWCLMIGQKAVCKYLRKKSVEEIVGVSNGCITIETEKNWTRWEHPFSTSKPILRTLNQITEEEEEIFKDLTGCGGVKNLEIKYNRMCDCVVFKFDSQYHKERQQRTVISLFVLDWLTQQGFDIRGYIKDGLAIQKED